MNAQVKMIRFLLKKKVMLISEGLARPLGIIPQYFSKEQPRDLFHLLSPDSVYSFI